ncbi:MAG: cyclic pyranopterin phosphate synthase MoaA [Planctomycetes bacterium RBG_13_60_9]|nr:MAG: cyclic pyranopterin phosphate synthase MoaA [Planctomycetes bacterium RBG_13_60_9]
MNVDYLRVSVTDRCNLRCIYCNPRGDHGLGDRAEMLDSDEIHRVVRLGADCGIRKVRLTGGEPLMRQDIANLVRRLAGVSGIEDLSLTTNGVFLGQMAAELKGAGLKRVNISLDAADRQCYQDMTGSDLLPRVTGGMHKAMEVGLTPVRLNCVVMRDHNLSQVQDLAQMTAHLPVSVRFIEYCPTTRLTGPASDYVPNDEVRSMIESRFGRLSSVVFPNAGGPAVYFKMEGALGAIGFISGRSSIFCQRCSRLRLTSDGKIRPCLHAARSYDIKELLRGGGSDDAIRHLIRQIIREKSLHTRLNSTAGDFLMQNVGG